MSRAVRLMTVAAVVAAVVAFFAGRTTVPRGDSRHVCSASPCFAILPPTTAEDSFAIDYTGRRATGTGSPVVVVSVVPEGKVTK